MKMSHIMSWTVVAALATSSAAWAQRAGTPRSNSNENSNRSSLVSQSEANTPRRAGATIPGSEYRRWSQMMNADVVLKNGDAAGSITDFVIGPQGNIEYLVGSNGAQLYTIPFGAAELNAQNQLQLGLTADQFETLPFFSNNNWPNFATPQFRGQMVNAFGQQAFNNAGGVAGVNNTGVNNNGVNTNPDVNTGIPYGDDALPSGNAATVGNVGNRSGVNGNLPNNNAGNASGTGAGLNGQNPSVGRRPGSITNSNPTAEQREQNRPNISGNANSTNRATGGGVQTGGNNATGPGLTPGTSGANARRPVAPAASPRTGTGGIPGAGSGVTPGPGIGAGGAGTGGTGVGTGGAGAGGPAIGTGAGAGGPPVGSGAGAGGPNIGTGAGAGGPNVGTGAGAGGGGVGTGTGAGAGGGAIGTGGAAGGGAAPK
ncbi:MAG TPA: hypothetical protein VFG20_17405 [Planctomycetaceae bacterium]|nr:hypothetical protein [Planctomycetaceae bacterium]